MRPSKEKLIEFKTLEEVAQNFDVSLRTARRWMESYDLFHPKENFGPNKINSRKAEQIRVRNLKGETPKDLAQEFRISLTNVYRIISKVYYPVKQTATITVIYNPSS